MKESLMSDSFRTCVGTRRGPFLLSPRRLGLLIGSCFSDEVGGCMRSAFWNVSSNPAGTLFNPASIASTIRLALSPRPVLRLFETGGTWRSWDFPTGFTGRSRKEYEERCLAALDITRRAILEGDFLIATFGSAVVYETDGAVVANCHKQPASTFTRRLLAPSGIADDWQTLLSELADVNPSLKVILTVSPVRHLADGLHTNNISKGTLHLAIHELAGRDLPLSTDYFPAYELLADELRDYRFYSDDMTHLSHLAVRYIWRHFQQTYLDDSSQKEIAEGESMRRLVNHRPLVPDSSEAKEFEKSRSRKLNLFLQRRGLASDPLED